METGLTSKQAKERLERFGPNEVAETRPRPWLTFLSKFWAPVPWMLEAAIVLQLFLDKPDEAIIIALLLVFNAGLSFVHENRANKALALLRNRLAVRARVRRDDRWQRIPAKELVPEDVVYLRLGDLVPADIRLSEGALLLDQSALTGESLPVEAGPGVTAYAGAVIKRGEATGKVVATGTQTYFGKTAELVQTARTVSHLESLIFTIVKYLIALDSVLVVALLIYSVATGMPLSDVVPFALILLVASVPAALPATFTLATALGAQELITRGVLVTRLSAIEEAAGMDILCSDKTGTLTRNRLRLAALRPYPPHTEEELLRLASMACDDAGQDPLDLAILAAARERDPLFSAGRRAEFLPFDPETRRTEAVFERDGQRLRIIKGAPRAVAAQVPSPPEINSEVERLAGEGYRVMAVAAGVDGALRFTGLLALEDPLREDSASLVHRLREQGVRVLMVTGDNLDTARAVASRVGIGNRACPAEALRADDGVRVLDYDVFARVFPEDKFRLVRALQQAGHVTGMTGDGVNDAPALKQAEVGVAVAEATDVAKSAAGLVLTQPGLSEVVAAVETSRRIYQRMLTYTLNKIVKTLEFAIFLSLGVMLTGVLVITPLLMVLLLFTNDFVTMAIAADRVSYSPGPDRWDIPTLMLTAGTLAVPVLILSFAVFFAARDWLRLPLPQLQTLIFVMLVFTGQGMVYLVRERRRFWHSRPGSWLLLSTFLDMILVAIFATRGILMAPIPSALVAGLLALVAGILIGVDFLKVGVFRYFKMR
ncbi:MAG TPA: plasma-membrane proton-efflux P-type ATPase [Nitrospiria bacterium]|nr:plasma-membrane proton-efflux P-type ATPase [Nitrospiria bacterium]